MGLEDDFRIRLTGWFHSAKPHLTSVAISAHVEALVHRFDLVMRCQEGDRETTLSDMLDLAKMMCMGV